MSYNMKCTYGLSSRLPSFFDRKYFSCNYMCFNKNVVDVCDEDSLEDSLLIETVQEKLFETAISISSLSEQIINVLENSHLEDTLSLTKGKKKKMKRRKKRKQNTKCDVIKEDEIHPPSNFSFSENEYLANNLPQWDNYIPNYPQRYYDNTSFSHITSEKESACSEDRLQNTVAVRKRKKLRRRKRKRKSRNDNENEQCNPIGCLPHIGDICCKNTPRINSCVYVKNNSEGGSDVDNVFDQFTSVKMKSNPQKNFDYSMNSVPHKAINAGEPNKDTMLLYKNKANDFPSDKIPKNSDEKNYNSKRNVDKDAQVLGVVTTVISRDAKIVGTGKANIDNETNIGDEDMKMIGRNTSIIDINKDMKLSSCYSASRKVIGEEKFSKEQIRQLRRRMKNVKRRPESYVVLGLI